MKRKRLDRDAWGFQYFPYYQMRVETEHFKGLVALICMTSGEPQYWECAKAGKVQVCGEGMRWLQLIPDGQKRVITVKYFANGAVGTERSNYPEWAREEFCPSVWYADVIDELIYDDEGIAVYVDKYLDVIFSPEGALV